MLKIQALVLFTAESALALHVVRPASSFQQGPWLTDEELTKEYHKLLLDGNTTFQLADQIAKDGEQGGKPDDRPAVLCFGDSISQGSSTVSASWVAAMSLRLPNLHFYNKGVNADHSWHLVQRLPAAEEVLLQHKDKPKYAIIMIGTNNAMASLNEKANQFFYHSKEPEKRILEFLQNSIGLSDDARSQMEKEMDRGYPKFKPENEGDPGIVPTLTNYEAQLTKLVHRAKQLGAKVAVMSQIPLGDNLSEEIPPASENEPFGQLDMAPNSRTQQYVDIAKRVAQSEGVDYLPINEKMRSVIQENNERRYGASSGIKDARVYNHVRFASLLRSNLLGRMQGQSFDSMTPPDLTLTHDFVHPNERGAAVIATMVHRWLEHVSKM